MSNERKYFDPEKIINTIYNKIALWHNNDDRLTNEELGRELRFVSRDIVEDVIRGVFGESSIKIDREKMEATDKDVEDFEKERKQRRENLEERLKNAVKKESEDTPS